VAEVGGEHRELLFDIEPLAMPAEKRPDSEAMSEVVYARPAVIAGASQTDLAGQAPENTMDILVQQSTAALGYKEMRVPARSEMSITPIGIAEQSFAGGPMQGHEARLSEFAITPNRWW
jgi:hypothetical protein